ncbi:MAG: outer membrane beta-barrel protein [Deltaproteobacteria bacterium]|nr:outer membrane beta-barrel protein [Deltaproteobacteria bacterium]
MKRLAIASAACGLLLFSGQALAADGLTVADALKDVQINGLLSAGYNYNFNEPHTRAINLRPFNDTHDSINLELAQLVFHKDAVDSGDAGFRLDLNFGYTVPKAIHATGATSSDDFDIRQAYISYMAPVGSGLRLDFGKFVTDHGLEVIEGYEDWNMNYSRSFLFYFSIPFTHTGLRVRRYRERLGQCERQQYVQISAHHGRNNAVRGNGDKPQVHGRRGAGRLKQKPEAPFQRECVEADGQSHLEG